MPVVIELLCSSYSGDHMMVIGLVGRVERVGRIEVHVAVCRCGNLIDGCHLLNAYVEGY
jgi:predicted DNA-binding protein with PD1-like motif